MQARLSSRDLGIRFGGHQAVNQVSLDFYPATLTALVGPNGAGKTTFFNLLSGQLPASTGQVLLEGQDITKWSVARRARAGIGRAFQLTNLFPNLTVAENVRLAVQAQQQRGWNFWQVWRDLHEVNQRAEHFLEAVNLSARRHDAVRALSHGDQRKLEVALMLALQPKVMMFDEPTAGMSVDEVPVILDLILQHKRDSDAAILLVEHKMDVLRSLADRVVVLHQGELVADGEPVAVMASATVQQAYLGKLSQPQAEAA